MPDKNTDFLAAAMKRIQQRRWEVLAAQVADKISIMIRVPAALLSRQLSAGDQAIQVAHDLAPDGWILTGFNYDGATLLVDLARDRLE